MPQESKESLIYIDDLTGLFNRRYLYSQLPQELKAAQEQKYNLWLFMLDIDNFKMVNDTYGHLAGDDVLRDVVKILQDNTKSDDKKIRYAGDEFTVILPRIDEKDVMSVAQRLVSKISVHHFRERRSNKEIKTSISIGIAGYPKDTSDAVELINLADKALYMSKQKGKDCVSTASDIAPELFWKKDILDRFPCPVLVERREELSRLKDVVNQLFESQGSMLLISGELGIGKSRLLNEAERFVISQQVNCLSVRCVDKFITQPYYNLGEALDRYLFNLDRLPQEFLDGIPGLEATALFKFLPVLKDISANSPVPIKEEILQEKDYLGPGLIKFLLNISKQKPLCLFFDDLQYMDAQSLSIILNLVQTNKQSPILVVATVCPEELTIPEIGVSPLASLIKTEIFQKRSETLPLPNLTPLGVQEMVANLFVDIPLPGSFSDIVYKKTKGNPLFVEELLKYVIEKEHIFYKNGKWAQKELNESSLPVSIEETIRARVEGLSDETREMIAKAAVIGEDFQVDLLQKIDSEDRGYILDLIESAKKIGLVYEKGMAGRDEFSFVTNEIRKVLFKTVGGERKKHFYSRLGEIKEKLYPDKLESIAGELYYNFKKAEDLVRAEQYAKIVKEGRGAFYDRTIKYAQSLLEEAAEVKSLPYLSKKAWINIPELVRSIYISSVNYLLYPPQNKMRAQSVEEIYKRLLMVFSETNIVNIACIEGSIIVNNRKVGRELLPFFANSFVSLLRNLNVESITFKKGVERSELLTLVDIISNPEKKEESIYELFERAQVRHIQIHEKTYDAFTKKSKEKESLEEVMLMDYLLGKFSFDDKKGDLSSTITTHAEEIAEAVEKLGEEASKKTGKDKEAVKAEIMAKSIQKIGSQLLDKGSSSWEKYKSGLAKTILSMEPNLRSNVLSSEIEDKEKGKVDIIEQLIHELSEDAIVDVLTTQYNQKDMNVEKMKKLLQRFLPDAEKRDKMIPVLKEKLKQAGANDEECAWIFQDDPWRELSAKEKAERILKLSQKTLMKILPGIRVGSIIRDLLSENEEKLIEEILKKLLTILEEGLFNPQILIVDFREILGVFIETPNFKLSADFMQGLVKICLNKEGLLSFFVSIVNVYIEKVIQIFLETGQLDLIKGIIQIYTKDIRIIQENDRIIEPVVIKIVEALVRKIDSRLDWAVLVEIVSLFKDRAGKILIEYSLFEEGVPEGKYFEAYLRRRTIGKILEQMPKDNLIKLLEAKSSDPRFYLLKNLIELIGSMEDEEIIKTLEVFLKRNEVQLRKKVIFALRKRKGIHSARLLGMALDDEDESARAEALHILKDRNDEFARQILQEHTKD